MADLLEESAPLLVEVRKRFTDFNRRLVWSETIPRAVSVRSHRDQCDKGSRMLSNSPDGRKLLYTASLAAISNNEVRHFNWLLALTEDVLSRDEVKPTSRPSWPIQEDIDDTLLRDVAAFCDRILFVKSDMFASLLQYAVLCGSGEIVENLISRVENVSSMSERWCPFLVKGFSCTALCLAGLQHEYSIMRVLLKAGASPYETGISRFESRDHYFPLRILKTWENHLVSDTVLQNPVRRRRQYPVSLLLITLLAAEASDPMIDFLQSIFQWNSVVSPDLGELEGVTGYLKSLSNVLQFPCYSEEDIICKQSICVRVLLFITGHMDWYWTLCFWDRNGSMFASIIRDMVRHGVPICGSNASVSSRLAARYQKSARRTPVPPDQGRCLFLHFRHFRAAPSKYVLPTLLARCANMHAQTPLTIPDAFALWDTDRSPAWASMSPATFGSAYFWSFLDVTRSLDNGVIQELFHCGALPGIKTLECVPFSNQDKSLHDGPTCQCAGIELSAAQRRVSVNHLLLLPNIVPSLQASCRTNIINSCQGHGVVHPIKKLPLPGQMIEYLLYNVSRDDSTFRH